MIPGFLSEHIKITKVKDASGAGTSGVTTDPVDMANWEGVVFVTSFATAAANNTLKAQQSNDAAGSPDDFSDLAGSLVASGDAEDVYLDITRPTKRYVQAVAARGTSTALGDIWAIQYGPRTQPQDNDVAGTSVGKQLHSPAEGTA